MMPVATPDKHRFRISCRRRKYNTSPEQPTGEDSYSSSRATPVDNKTLSHLETSVSTGLAGIDEVL